MTGGFSTKHVMCARLELTHYPEQLLAQHALLGLIATLTTLLCARTALSQDILQKIRQHLSHACLATQAVRWGFHQSHAQGIQETGYSDAYHVKVCLKMQSELQSIRQRGSLHAIGNVTRGFTMQTKHRVSSVPPRIVLQASIVRPARNSLIQIVTNPATIPTNPYSTRSGFLGANGHAQKVTN